MSARRGAAVTSLRPLACPFSMSPSLCASLPPFPWPTVELHRSRFTVVRDSELLSGQIGKKTVGKGGKRGLMCAIGTIALRAVFCLSSPAFPRYTLLNEAGEQVAARFLSALAKLSSRYIGEHGFSVGVLDVMPTQQLMQEKVLFLALPPAPSPRIRAHDSAPRAFTAKIAARRR